MSPLRRFRGLVQRAVAIAWLMGAAPASALGDAGTGPFANIPPGHWVYDAVQSLAQTGVLQFSAGLSLAQDLVLTRSELALMVGRTLAGLAEAGDIPAGDQLGDLEVRDLVSRYNQQVPEDRRLGERETAQLEELAAYFLTDLQLLGASLRSQGISDVAVRQFIYVPPSTSMPGFEAAERKGEEALAQFGIGSLASTSLIARQDLRRNLLYGSLEAALRRGLDTDGARPSSVEELLAQPGGLVPALEGVVELAPILRLSGLLAGGGEEGEEGGVRLGAHLLLWDEIGLAAHLRTPLPNAGERDPVILGQGFSRSVGMDVLFPSLNVQLGYSVMESRHPADEGGVSRRSAGVAYQLVDTAHALHATALAGITIEEEFNARARRADLGLEVAGEDASISLRWYHLLDPKGDGDEDRHERPYVGTAELRIQF